MPAPVPAPAPIPVAPAPAPVAVAETPASVEAPAEAALPAPVAAAEVETVPARPAAADTQELALVEGGLSPKLAAEVVGETVSHLLPFGTPRQLKRLVRSALARRIPVAGPRAAGGAAIALAGAGGSGKTLTVARLAAAYAARSDLDVVVLALRPRDGGAELRGLLAPAGVAVEVLESAADAEARLAEAAGRALVLVDTPAVSPGDEDAVRALAAELRGLEDAEVHVCMPATLSAAAAGRLLGALAPLRPSGVVLTHVDETPQVGAVVELAIAGGPPLTFVGRDSGIEGGLEIADAAAVAALVLA
jgi:flagellar biosynthesis GTPase FlhF